MAGPHVAGAVALLWSAQPALRNDIAATEAVLNESAVDVISTACSSPAGVPNNTWGYGRLDIKAAADQLALVTAVSRKLHGALEYDIPLPLTGEPGVECRSSGGNHTLVITLNNPVASGNAVVSSGTGTAGSPTIRRQHHDGESDRRDRHAKNYRDFERRYRDGGADDAEYSPEHECARRRY